MRCYMSLLNNYFVIMWGLNKPIQPLKKYEWFVEKKSISLAIQRSTDPMMIMKTEQCVI